MHGAQPNPRNLEHVSKTERQSVEQYKADHGGQAPLGFGRQAPSTRGKLHEDNAHRIARELRLLMDEPSSSKVAMLYSIFMFLMILFSVVTLVVGTMPPRQLALDSWMRDASLEIFFNVVFTVELVVRMIIAKSFLMAASDFYNWVDFFSVLPFWIEELASGGGDTGVLAMLGGLKMMRLVKLMRKFEGSIILVESIKESAAALFVPFFFLIVMVMLFASTIFFVEDFIKPQKAQFESIPHAIWFMVVTMTTVGYGDVSPHTTGGKMVCIVAMVMGVLFLAMPILAGNMDYYHSYLESIPE